MDRLILPPCGARAVAAKGSAAMLMKHTSVYEITLLYLSKIS